LSGTASTAAATDARIDAPTEGIDATTGGSAQNADEQKEAKDGSLSRGPLDLTP
jgi:hypothetical protein